MLEGYRILLLGLVDKSILTIVMTIVEFNPIFC